MPPCSELVSADVQGAVEVYFGHDRMRRPISSFDTARAASESASPRCTMTWKASSRTMSSDELSSGCFWIRRVSSSFAVDMGFLPSTPLAYHRLGSRPEPPATLPCLHQQGGTMSVHLFVPRC